MKQVEGLRLLNRADPFVEVEVLESGEHVLGAAGEVHLETCVKDLQERFARIQLQVRVVPLESAVFFAVVFAVVLYLQGMQPWM